MLQHVIFEWLLIGGIAVSFILIGKQLTVSYNVPVLKDLFAAV